jgi:hypothetical protein
MDVVDAALGSTTLGRTLERLGIDVGLESELCRADSRSSRLGGLGFSSSKSVVYPD